MGTWDLRLQAGRDTSTLDPARRTAGHGTPTPGAAGAPDPLCAPGLGGIAPARSPAARFGRGEGGEAQSKPGAATAPVDVLGGVSQPALLLPVPPPCRDLGHPTHSQPCHPSHTNDSGPPQHHCPHTAQPAAPSLWGRQCQRPELLQLPGPTPAPIPPPAAERSLVGARKSPPPPPAPRHPVTVPPLHGQSHPPCKTRTLSEREALVFGTEKSKRRRALWLRCRPRLLPGNWDRSAGGLPVCPWPRWAPALL